LYPGLSETIKIVEKQMRGENRTRAGEKEAEMDDEEDSDEEAIFFCDIEFVTVAIVFVSLHF
jgi:mannose/fructose-specific phosphotransferase system component IIA